MTAETGPLAPESTRSALSSPRFVIGVMALLLGALYLGEELGWFDIEPIEEGWPALLIAFGAIRLFAGSIGWAIYWLCIGGALLVNNLAGRPIELGEAIFPLGLLTLGGLLVSRTAGARMGWHARWGDGEEAGPWRDQASGGRQASLEDGGEATGSGSGKQRVSAFALLGGLNRRITGVFAGGDAAAVMGGCEIDLRKAKGTVPGASIDVLAFWGGVDIWIPEGWQVDDRVTPILAGVEDKTRSQSLDDSGVDAVPRPSLVIRGLAIMGGVTVSHGPGA